VAKAVGYFREGDPYREGEPSLTEQNRAFMEFCRRDGYEVAATFLDTNGAEDAGFRQMVDYLRDNGGSTTVVVDSLQRLGRNMRRTARAYFQLEGMGVQVVTLDGEPSATESLIASWTSRDSSERAGERVRAAMRQKAIKGEVLGRPPYGYGVGPKRRLMPIPEEAALVRHMFRLYNQEGLGIRLIARRLNEEGHRTRRGGNWSMVTIRDILRNRAYLGTYARFGVRVPGSHPAIISPEDYRKAQDRMSRRRTAGGPKSVNNFLLSGLAYCGYCNNRLIGVSRRQSWHRQGDGTTVQAEYRYYQCETRTNQSMCDYHTHRALEFEEEVRSGIEDELRRQIEAPDDHGDADVEEELRALKNRLRALDRRLEQLLDAGSDGRIPADEVRQLSVEVAQQQLTLEQSVADVERRARLRENQGARRAAREELMRLVAAEHWAGIDFAQRQQFLQQVLHRAVAYDNALQISLRPV
jgi:site-specific DNA recombinase